jgi:hypothetical protein
MIAHERARSKAGEWKKKNPVQVPSRRTKGKNLPVKVKRFTDR